ncbi:MAG: 3-dehydroquinate synthase [Phycisphaerae bacterium]|nr:3-dehydroquinate synthase [Phycisphaerae bacterium]
MTIVAVTGPFAHEVVVEAGALASLGSRVRATGAARVLLAVDRAIVASHGARAHASLTAAGCATTMIELVANEKEKTMPAVEALWSAALAASLTRRDAFLALGGGLVGDVVGFAAASYLRGVTLVQAPTTLLAMVDASTGGKTGINLRLPDGSLGKNLAGAFWPPAVVVADPDTLSTLPDREYRSGLAECIKHAIIDGEAHLAFLEASMSAIVARDPNAIAALVARSVAVKAAVVSRDPREAGERATLNLGHTFAHAFETLDGLDLLHGEAVAIGLMAAQRLAEAENPSDPARRSLAARVERLLVAARLPTSLPTPVAASAIEARMGFDKKSDGRGVRFVVPVAAGEVRYGVAVEGRSVRDALAAIGASAS